MRIARILKGLTENDRQPSKFVLQYTIDNTSKKETAQAIGELLG